MAFFIYCSKSIGDNGASNPGQETGLKKKTPEPVVPAKYVVPAPKGSDNWPSFRGIHASGISGGQGIPLHWDIQAGTNIKWKLRIPGLGHSSPVVWKDKVFITTAKGKDDEPYLKIGLYGQSPDNLEKYDHHYIVYCIDKDTGKIVWERTAYVGVPKVNRHVKSSHATCTIATDGTHVAAFFGSQGLYVYDMAGKLLWKKDLGLLDSGAFDYPEIQWGFGSSPVIYKDKLIVLCDVNNQSFIACFDVATGKENWRTLRDETPTWGTPTVYEGKDRTQVIVNGYKHRGGYDFYTGKALWWFKGGGDIPVPTPIVAHGLIFFSSGHGRLRPIYAVKLNAQGDISLGKGETSNEFVAWAKLKQGAYIPTPIVYGDYLYVGKDNGILACYKAKTGEELYRKRIADKYGSYSASPVAADGRIYFTEEHGNIHIIQAGPEYRYLASNQMNEPCMATPAISGKMLFIRTSRHLYAISNGGSNKNK
jgi:outer membrane protein assembly factor BamB